MCQGVRRYGVQEERSGTSLSGTRDGDAVQAFLVEMVDIPGHDAIITIV